MSSELYPVGMRINVFWKGEAGHSSKQSMDGLEDGEEGGGQPSNQSIDVFWALNRWV